MITPHNLQVRQRKEVAPNACQSPTNAPSCAPAREVVRLRREWYPCRVFLRATRNSMSDVSYTLLIIAAGVAVAFLTFAILGVE